MNKYLIEYGIAEEFKYNAGSKARVDILNILEKRGFKCIFLNQGKSKIEKIKHLINIDKHLMKIENNSIVCIPFPLCNSLILNSIIKELKKKRCKIICIIHDINSLRFHGENSKQIKADIKILNKFDSLVVHNKRMHEWLIKEGIKVKCIELKVFDYLIDEDKDNTIGNYDGKIIFAGNLSKDKSEFLYNIDEDLLENIGLNLFGANLEMINNKNIKYKGKFNPNKLPVNLEGKYGLIWDGNSVETCEGFLGEYLRYNNPHKLSLYIAMGIPVIVWDESAVSEFVNKEQIGVSISCLSDIKAVIERDNYKQMKNNVDRIRNKVINGYFIINAIEECIDSI